MREFVERHRGKIALMFSGGRDSLACLLLAREFWHELDVVWVNPGNPYGETLAQMQRIRSMVPHFVEVNGTQPQFIREHGHPVDVVPLSMTPFGSVLARSDPSVRVVPAFRCCTENLWGPAGAFIAGRGYSGVIRGDKACDALKPPVRSGDHEGGIEYLFPLETWSDEDVTGYVGEMLPASYRRGVRTSLDCRDCTAYLAHNVERIADLKMIDPPAYATVCRVLRAVASEAQRFAAAVAQVSEVLP